MILDTLVPMLQKHFPDSGLVVKTLPRLCVIFPAAHPEVGDIQLECQGNEVVIYAGHVTHGHVANYDEMSDEEKAQVVIEDVIDFLKAVFADQVAFWGSRETGGGWRRLDSDPNRNLWD